MNLGQSQQVLVNKELFEIFEEGARNSKFTLEVCDMKYTGEDFDFFSLEYPSLMFWAKRRKSGFA